MEHKLFYFELIWALKEINYAQFRTHRASKMGVQTWKRTTVIYSVAFPPLFFGNMMKVEILVVVDQIGRLKPPGVSSIGTD